jgi:hypothetical protein
MECPKKIRRLRIGDGEIGKEYISKFGKIIQYLGKSGSMAKICVRATDKRKDIPFDYLVYERIEEEHVEIEPEIVIEVETVEDSTSEVTEMVEQHSEATKATIKSLVIDMLLAGTQTKDSLARAVIDAKLTKNTNLKKVKGYIGIILSNIKKKKDLKFVSEVPGRYRIDK